MATNEVEITGLPSVVSLNNSDLLLVRQGVEDKKSTFSLVEQKLNGSYLRQDDNLNSLSDKSISRTNLDVYSKSESDDIYLNESSNLNDVPDKGQARTNLNVYSKTESDDRYLNESSNLSDVDDAATSFDNIKQPATTTSAGAVEKATDTEAEDATADKFPDAAGVHKAFNQYGLGINVNPFGRVLDDIDDSTLRSGSYVTDSSTTGTLPPFSSSFFVGIMVIDRLSTDGLSQTWINMRSTDNERFIRFRDEISDTWGDWDKILHTGNASSGRNSEVVWTGSASNLNLRSIMGGTLPSGFYIFSVLDDNSDVVRSIPYYLQNNVSNGLSLIGGYVGDNLTYRLLFLDGSVNNLSFKYVASGDTGPTISQTINKVERII